MTIVFKRYDVFSDEAFENTVHVPNAEGDWVKAQDAYDKCAGLSAEITTLKAQLKGYQEREKLFRAELENAEAWRRLWNGQAQTLGPAWDYIQANPDKFGAIPGDDKTLILVESFMKSHKD